MYLSCTLPNLFPHVPSLTCTWASSPEPANSAPQVQSPKGPRGAQEEEGQNQPGAENITSAGSRDLSPPKYNIPDSEKIRTLEHPIP